MTPQCSTSAIPRAPPYRILSQQYVDSPPSRRENDVFMELSLDGDVAQGLPRIGISRLRVEISTASSNDDILASPRYSSDAMPPCKSAQPPRGRPLLHSDIPQVSPHNNICALDILEKNTQTIKAMPMPARPGRHRLSDSGNLRSSITSSTKKDFRPKPYVIEIPTAAPRYHPNGYADFFPWTGNHPEDQFSESVIRHGYYDKPQMTQNETGSARQSIFPALKHKSGLQTLSSIFTSILAQRRTNGQITSPSTFKPPPRVTVTDTKREMWLKDLANPTISLRRLSRSIPHGIRGKILLEQSLSKSIPIERAVWLAKCVGANELRSFRRKGVSGTFTMGGEAKWIRDFTVCVEQFLESIIGTCGDPDFKIRICYAIRLATHFHAEFLLDREHYMDWLVTSLENSTQLKLPLWLLVTQIYWKELLQYRKYGRRLTSALLNQLAEIATNPDSDILAPLSERLMSLLKGLMLSNPDSFVAPKIWAKHKRLVYVNLGSDDKQLLSVIEKIDARNCRIVVPNAAKEQSPQLHLINLLDGSLTSPYTNKTMSQGWELTQDKTLLIRTVLDWSSSSYRPGSTKIYVGARLLRSWSKLGADITGEILNFLVSASCESGRNKVDFYHLVSELSRSGHFSMSTYLQWLIARGGIYNSEAFHAEGPCASRLLAELPIFNLSDGIFELRMTLLNRANFSVDEGERTRQGMLLITKKLHGMQADVDLEMDRDELPADTEENFISNASRTTKSEIGLWLREKVGSQMVHSTSPSLGDRDRLPIPEGTCQISLSDFNTVREYLELISDYSMLADVLKMISSSNDADVLASCTETLNLHVETFAAIGALRGLLGTLLSRLRNITEEVDFVPRTFLVALLDLTSRLEDHKILNQQLAQELSRSDRKTAADACSPISDHMTIFETVEADFTDEIDKVLASGNSMDQATLERLFRKIISRLEDSWSKPPEQQRGCALLLTRLRAFDTLQFDLLMASWVDYLLRSPVRPSLIQVCGPLISFGCLALRDVLVGCEKIDVKNAALNDSRYFTICLEALILLASSQESSHIMTAEERYRFRIKQRHTQRNFPVNAMSIIRVVLELLVTSPDSSDTLATLDPRLLLQSFDVREMLQNMILLDADLFIKNLLLPVLRSSNTAARQELISTINVLLLSHGSSETVTTETLLSVTDNLSLSFCQVKLASIFSSADDFMGDEEDSSRFEAFDKAIESAVAAGNTTWAKIVPLLDTKISQHLRQRTEIQFISLIPSFKTIIGTDSSSLQRQVSHAENYLRIIDATSHSMCVAPSLKNNAALISDIASAMNGLWLLLMNSPSQELKDSVVGSWIPLLLHFTTFYLPVFEANRSRQDSRAKIIMTLAAIYLQLQALEVITESLQSMIEHCFDLALALVDSLPDDLRQQCIRSLRDISFHPRISYLFSFTTSPIEHLFLSQKERCPSSHPSTNSSDARIPDKDKEKHKDRDQEKLLPFYMRRWEMLGEPTPNVGENDTSLSLTMFGARRG